jgi:hypothetical protein
MKGSVCFKGYEKASMNVFAPWGIAIKLVAYTNKAFTRFT